MMMEEEGEEVTLTVMFPSSAKERKNKGVYK